MPILAADLGGTKLATAAFSTRGELLARASVALDGRAGNAVATLMIEQLAALAGELPQTDRLDTVGVSVPGIYRADRGTVWAPNIPGWEDFPLRDALGDALPHVRVSIDSDRAAYILGESWCGAAAGARDAIFLAVGTGIGAGILVDGRVLRGHGDVAGAIGWLALERPYTPAWAQCGCFEHQASGPGLVRVARELNGVDTTPADLFAAYERGEALATRVVDNAVELWGMAAANLVSLFNPETIVFGGGVFGPATRFIPRIRAEAEKWAQPIAIQQVRFVESMLGPDVGLYGAARMAAGQ